MSGYNVIERSLSNSKLTVNVGAPTYFPIIVMCSVDDI